MLSADDEKCFLDAMQCLGLQAHSQQVLESDGKIHRYRITGEKSGSLNGWYVLYSDGAVPAGAFGSWKTGDSQNWCAKSERTLSPSEREEWHRKQQETQQARTAAQLVVRQEARSKATTLLDKAGKAVAIAAQSPDDGADRVHPYIQKKGIKPFGAMTLNSSLVIPLRNSKGELTSLQFIQADGGKKFLTGGEITGCYFAIGKPVAVIGICEGYATGATLYEAKHEAIAIAFNAGNLLAVARSIREKFPAIDIIIYADNDQATEGNPGLSKATEAAKQVGGRVLVPTFLPHELIDDKIPTDFNDLHRLHGIDAVRLAMETSSNPQAVINDAGGEEVRAEKLRPTRQDLMVAIDACDDFDILTTDMVMQVANGQFVRPAFESLITKIAKKAGVPKGSLLDYIKQVGGSGNDKTVDNNDGRIDELNLKHAVLPIGGRILVMNRDYDPVMERQLLTFSAKTDFEMRYCNRKMFDRGEEVGLGTYWINHPRRAEFDGMVFSPGDEQPGYLNLWTGWGANPMPGDCQKYLDFIFDVIASGNPALYNYIIYWFAHLLQHPQELPETALVFRGREGIGKDTLMKPLRAIVGNEHYLMLSSLNQITGRFSGHLATALLVFCNESVWGGDKSAQGVLKSMITDDVQPIEHKGRDLFMVKSYRRMVFATNENWAVPRGADDRRYVITDVSDAKKGDYPYFKGIHDQMQTGGTEALMHFLLSIDISGWHPRQIPEALQVCGWELKIRSGGSIVQWWFDLLQQGWIKKVDTRYAEEDQHAWPELLPATELQASYLAWCMAYKINHPEHSVVIGHQIKDWGIQTCRPRHDNPNRKLFYQLPSLERAQEIFSKRFAIPESVWDVDVDVKPYV